MQTLPYEQMVSGADGVVLQGTYRLGKAIGRGGMGVVYEATHARLPGRFAVKFLSPDLATDAEALRRFNREAEILSELRHPNVVQIVDFNLTPEGLPYIVMEHLEGGDLEATLNSSGRMELPCVVPVVDQIASALNAAHRHGIVHRDLKPSNIFLAIIDGQDDPFVKVLDFGVSKINAEARSRTGAEIVGTPHYMAPEQALGRIEQVAAQTDQFALASITYEMLTGQRAFAGGDVPSLLYQIVHERPQPLSQLLEWDCAGVQAVLDRASSKDPALRYPSIGDFARALKEVAESALAPATAPLVPEVPFISLAATTREPMRAEEITELTTSIDRVPRSPYRTALLAGVAVALVGGVSIKKGWTREIPDNVEVAYRGLVRWVKQSPPAAQPPAAATPASPLAPAPERAAPPPRPVELATLPSGGAEPFNAAPAASPREPAAGSDDTAAGERAHLPKHKVYRVESLPRSGVIELVSRPTAGASRAGDSQLPDDRQPLGESSPSASAAFAP
jgi:serine/threonine protein kinase